MRPMIFAAVFSAIALAAPAAVVDLSRPKTSITNAPFAEIPAVIDAQLRVRPDRRFVLATVDLHELLERKSVKASINFVNGAWELRIDDKVAATLTEVPTFGETLDRLTTIASVHPKRENAVEDARTLTRLNVQTPDHAGIADPLRARALALLAIARAADRKCCAEEVAMLAELFGYEVEARALADKLPQNSVARAYVRRTSASGADPLAQWVSRRSRILAAVDDAERTRLFEREATSIEAVVQFLENTSEETAPKIARAVALAAAEEVAGRTVTVADALKSDTPLDAIARDFDGHLVARSRATATPLLSEELLAIQYAARFLSAMEVEFDHAYAAQNDADASRATAGKLAGTTFPQLRQFGEWMETRAKVRWEGGQGVRLAETVARLHLLGSFLRARIVSGATSSAQNASEDLSMALWNLYPELDTRPTESIFAGSLAWSIFADPMRRDRDYGSGVMRAPRGRGRGWRDRSGFYARSGNVAALKETTDAADATPDERSHALEALSERDDADDAFLRSRFERLLQNTTAPNAYAPYASYLNERRDWKTKERVARRMLERLRGVDNWEKRYYVSSLADALERQGRYEEAWTLLEPHVRESEGMVVATAVSLLERRGKKDEAEELGRQLIFRHPAGARRADFAAVLWRMGKYREAAEILDPKHQYPFSPLGTYLPEVFTETFEKATVSETVDAFVELAKVDFETHTLMDVSTRFAKLGAPEKAVVLALAYAEVYPQRRFPLIAAWKLLRDEKGIDAANAWLRTSIADDEWKPLAAAAAQNDADDLLWSFFDADEAADSMLLLITLAAVKQRVSPSDARWQSLVAALEALGPAGAPLRYLVGKEDESTLYEIANAVETARPLLAYFIGVRAAASGDYDKALPWLLTASVRQDRSLPANGAWTILRRWSDAKMSWSEIKKKRLP